MTSISFDNPYLLLIGAPLLLLVVIPYFIAIRKENKSKSTVITLCLHTVMIALISLAVAGIHTVTVKTKTEIFIVADLSYSTDRDVEVIDGYIKDILSNESLPTNTQTGVVCFGKEALVNTPLGGKFTTVKGTAVDSSVTDISGALEYTSNLFSGDAIKRIVLITDAEQNTSGGSNGMLNSIKNMEVKNILVDAIYVNSNLKDDEYEVQLSGVEYLKATFADNEATVNVLIESNTEYVPNSEKPRDKNDCFVRLYDGEGNLIKEQAAPLKKGYNMVTLKLDSSLPEGKDAKITDYRVVVEANHDTSTYNNQQTFTQKIVGEYKVLLLSQYTTDFDKAKEMYGEDAVTRFNQKIDKNIPYTLEELCQYDIFILSDVDVNDINNGGAFVVNLNTAVSKFGKTLITAGSTCVSNKSGAVYETLSGMSAVDYGGVDAGDPVLYTILIDASRSMQDASQLIMAKEAAIQLLDLMKAGDEVMVVSFAAGITIVHEKCEALKNKDKIKNAIMNDIKPTQGTVLGAGLRLSYEMMKDEEDYSKKQVLLVSDGRTYTGVGEKDEPIKIAKDLIQAGIYVSTINTNSVAGIDLLKQIAKIGQGGKDGVGYFFVETPEQVKNVVSTDVAPLLYETEINEETAVRIKDYSDPLVSGIASLPSIGGYYFGRSRSDTKVVLEVDNKLMGGDIISVPLYSYKKYENGLVISLSTKLSGKWVSKWEEIGSPGITVFNRMLTENIPSERIDYPFTFSTEYEGSKAELTVIPGEPNPDIVVEMEIIAPNEETTKTTLYYDNGEYTTDYEIKEAGKYYVNIAYKYGETIFPASLSFDIPYLSEYDRFELFDSANLYNAVSNGIVSEDGHLEFEESENMEQPKFVYFTIPLMIIAVTLYVIDIIVRKLKWSDIKSFFGRRQTGGGESK